MSQLTAEDLKATFDAFNRHDIEGVMKHFADDCVFYTVGGPDVHGTRIEGKAAIAQAFSAVWEGMKDAHWAQRGHFVAGDRAVVGPRLRVSGGSVGVDEHLEVVTDRGEG